MSRITTKNLSLQVKVTFIYILANILIFIVNIILFFGINEMTNKMNMVYTENLKLNHLAESLTDVQNNMNEYLNT
ncbi:MAG: hypothetical protein ACRC7V_06315, partial [Lachnospiraceae bacterium]